jgi:hypothetical protein
VEQRTYTSLRDVGAHQSHHPRVLPNKNPEHVASYHFSAQIISRGQGRSAIAAAAYRSASRLVDRRTGQVHDYQRKRGVVHTEIMLPRGAAPWLADREALWNHAQARETRRDAQLCREINIALPHELAADQRLELLRTFVMEEFVAKGMIADIAVHAPVVERGQDPRNHHAHVMLTLRQADAQGLYLTKTRAWNSRDHLKSWRHNWSHQQNLALERHRLHDRVDHRSLADQRHAALAANDHARARTLDRVPEIHVGPAAFAMHEAQRRPRALTPLPLPNYVPTPLPSLFSVIPPTLPMSAPPASARQTHRQQTLPLAPVVVEPRRPSLYEPPQAKPTDRPPSARNPTTPKFKSYAPHKPFVRDTWRFEIVPRQRRRTDRPRKPLLALTLRETRPRRAWKAKVRPRERLTRLEFNLARIERNRLKATAWVRRAQARQARMMARWRKWRGVMWWLITRSTDPAQIARLFKRLLSDHRLRLAVAEAVQQAKAEEARLHRRCYDVRVKLHREYLQSLQRGRHRARRK